MVIGFKRKLILFVTLVALFSLPNAVFAHAHLQSSTPESDGSVTQLENVRLTFTEPVHVNQSIFRVYALDDEDDPLLLKGKASELVATVLDAATRRQTHDETGRVDVGIVETSNISAQITIELKEHVTPGPYAVMWKVRSIDTHITDGFFVFHYEPTQ